MPAPKQNKYGIGNSGQSKKFESVADLQLVIDNYFDECDARPDGVDTRTRREIIEDQIPYTIEGLAVALGVTRATLNNYEKQEGYEEFFYTIKRAKAKVQQNKIERALMFKSHASVSIFDLKNNHGYVDKAELTQNITLPDLGITTKTIIKDK